jgi:hypothetical protein
MTATTRRAVLFAALACATAPALAQATLEEAKAVGLVGERPDGLVGLVEASASADVIALVDEVNAKRMARYAQVAAENNSTVEQVQAVAGAQLIERTPAGQFVMNAAGRWIRK